MSVTEVCKEMGLSRPAIYRRIADGRLHPLPKENPNRDREPLLFDRAEVEALKEKSFERLAQPAPAKTDTPKE